MMKDLYDSAASSIVETVRGLRDSDLELATPCAQYDVRALVMHLTHVAVEMQKGARHREMDLLGEPGPLRDDWREYYAERAAALAAAWSDPQALTGEPLLGIPRETLIKMPLIDLVLHRWDLNRATGRDFAVDPALIGGTHEHLVDVAPMGRQMGAFDEPVAVPDTASTLDKFVALSGRDPNWSRS